MREMAATDSSQRSDGSIALSLALHSESSRSVRLSEKNDTVSSDDDEDHNSEVNMQIPACIVKARVAYGQKQFRIQWVGHPNLRDSTWERESLFAPEHPVLVEQWLEEEAARERAEKKKKKRRRR